MAATYQTLLGQIIKLARSISIQKPVDEKGFKLEFTAKIPGLELPGFGLTLTLWKTERSFKAIKNIARMIRSCHRETVDCDNETIEGLILDTIQDLVLNESIFKRECIFSSSQKCLADCRTDQNINEFSNKIHDQLMIGVHASISQWCTVLGVPRVMCESFDIPQAGITLISRMDESKWEETVSSRFNTNNWSHVLGYTPDSGEPQLIGCEYKSLLVHQTNGTQEGTKFASRLEFARFFALLYATLTVKVNIRLSRAMAEPNKWCMQFPSRNSSGLRTTQSQLSEAVFPFFCADFQLGNDVIALIQNWYVALGNLADHRKVRVEKACHFVNRGIITQDLDSYVNFFISLDALFGEEREVERSIKRGIDSIPIANGFKERVSWLYDLRNELVHGGSRFCAEWRYYDRYYSHFLTKPEEDVERIACVALLHSVTTN
jgi:hypothetical protein